jgi:hypothetical protein
VSAEICKVPEIDFRIYFSLAGWHLWCSDDQSKRNPEGGTTMVFSKNGLPQRTLERPRTEFGELLEHFGFDRREARVWPIASNRPAIESSIDSDNCGPVIENRKSSRTTYQAPEDLARSDTLPVYHRHLMQHSMSRGRSKSADLADQALNFHRGTEAA